MPPHTPLDPPGTSYSTPNHSFGARTKKFSSPLYPQLIWGAHREWGNWVIEPHGLPLKNRVCGVREKLMQSHGLPNPKTHTWDFAQSPLHSSLCPKKPLKLPGKSGVHENTGWERWERAPILYKGIGVQRVHELGNYEAEGPRLQGTMPPNQSDSQSQPQSNTARRGHILSNTQSE